ncbi:MAG: bifunctional nicotinamidase/pyrazinamidase [Nitrososphaerota archaeon]|nr:bifunctional nicotinamidase/pyrazinamidase [Nitrososphaerota archaeon]
MKHLICKEDALIIVDVQIDFCPGGMLPVPEGDKIVPILNRYINKFRSAGATIVATRDWHPPNHCSFREQGGSWPPHCIQETEGAMFHRELDVSAFDKIVSKASTPSKEAYSGFDGTDLEEYLKSRNIRRVFIGGLATDYCVKSTVLDAVRMGFQTYLLEDAVKGVNVRPCDSERAIDEMIKSGARKIRLEDLV